MDFLPLKRTRTKDQGIQYDDVPPAPEDMQRKLDLRDLRNASTSPTKSIISLGDSLPVRPISFSSAEHQAFREWFSQSLEENRVLLHQEIKHQIGLMLFSHCATEAVEPGTDDSLFSSPVKETSYFTTKRTSTTTKGTIDNIIEGATVAGDDFDERIERVSVSHALHTVLDGLRSLHLSRHPRSCWYTLVRCCRNSGSRGSSIITEADQTAQVTTHLFKDAIESGRLDLFVGGLIIVNAMVMVLQLEYYGYLSELTLGQREEDGSWNNADQWFLVIEHVFNALFLLELAIRLRTYKTQFFKYPSLLCDAVLVLLSSFQIYFLDVVEEDNGDKVSIYRVLRFIRFVRVLRLIRVLKLFASLRVLVKTVISSFGALVWSMVLLLVIMVNGGLVLSVLLRDFIKNPDNDIVARKWVFKHYGTATRAIYTLFEVTLAGCWPNYFRPLIDEVSVWYALFAMVYVTIVVFAIIRIITAMFLKETLQMASEDAEMMVREKLKNKDNYIKKLGNVFKAVDANGDGKLNLEEFEHIFSNQVVKAWLQVLELELHDAQALFALLKNEEDEITYDEFLKGLMRLKGQARTMDVVGLMHSADLSMQAMTNLQQQLNEVQAEVKKQAVVRRNFVPSVSHSSYLLDRADSPQTFSLDRVDSPRKLISRLSELDAK